MIFTAFIWHSPSAIPPYHHYCCPFLLRPFHSLLLSPFPSPSSPQEPILNQYWTNTEAITYQYNPIKESVQYQSIINPSNKKPTNQWKIEEQFTGSYSTGKNSIGEYLTYAQSTDTRTYDIRPPFVIRYTVTTYCCQNLFTLGHYYYEIIQQSTKYDKKSKR